MPLEDRDAACLWDMLQAAHEAVEMMKHYELAAFQENRVMLRAAERIVELIGESARHVSAAGKEATPDIPWHQIIGQRKILAHEYGHIDHELLYRTVVDDIPDLIRRLEIALPEI